MASLFQSVTIDQDVASLYIILYDAFRSFLTIDKYVLSTALSSLSVKSVRIDAEQNEPFSTVNEDVKPYPTKPFNLKVFYPYCVATVTVQWS